MPTTVHVVFQAHLDPVWLWPWPAGLDEALNTCRTACNLLDRHPAAVFTMGEAWRYREIERMEPELFERVRAHVRAGRWEVVGGWWIQPDCNFPDGFGLERQIETGKRYFTERFGTFPEVAYNVDSFGHAATLPQFISAAGQKYYVMMRPQEHERPLPARLFRWRGFEGGPEITAFRIAGAYCTGTTVDAVHVRKALTGLPEGVEHTMCFVGVGDHGGGMTGALIEWVKANADSIDGAKLIFSSPARFFKAVASQMRNLPLVTGELQMHAVGCYTVERGIKTRVRRTEHLLRQAEVIAEGDPHAGAVLEAAWRHVCFNHFHDALCGTCVPSAYPQLYAQLGAAASAADDLLQHTMREKMRALPDDPRQRAVFFNASEAPFDAWVEFEPWTQWTPWNPAWRFADEQNRTAPCQILPREASTGRFPRVLARLQAEPRAWRVLHLDRDNGAGEIPNGMSVGDRRMDNGGGVGVVWTEGKMIFPAGRLALPRLELIEDRSDTWSHGVERYPEGPVESAHWNATWPGAQGPLMASAYQTGRIGDSRLQAEWRLYADEPFVEWHLRVHWRETFKLLKLVLPLPGGPLERRDGIPGGSLLRPNVGKECPLRDWTLCSTGGGQGIGVVSPDVYALDGTAARLRFTLLRSPVMAHHDPNRTFDGHPRVADQGEHDFRFLFFFGPVTPERLERQARMLHRPLLFAETTRGMPRRWE